MLFSLFVLVNMTIIIHSPKQQPSVGPHRAHGVGGSQEVKTITRGLDFCHFTRILWKITNRRVF